jgi:hypothetical protein
MGLGGALVATTWPHEGGTSCKCWVTCRVSITDTGLSVFVCMPFCMPRTYSTTLGGVTIVRYFYTRLLQDKRSHGDGERGGSYDIEGEKDAPDVAKYPYALMSVKSYRLEL